MDVRSPHHYHSGREKRKNTFRFWILITEKPKPSSSLWNGTPFYTVSECEVNKINLSCSHSLLSSSRYPRTLDYHIVRSSLLLKENSAGIGKWVRTLDYHIVVVVSIASCRFCTNHETLQPARRSPFSTVMASLRHQNRSNPLCCNGGYHIFNIFVLIWIKVKNTYICTFRVVLF